MIHIAKGFNIVSETEVDVFLEFPCFLYDLANVGNMVSGSSAFSKPSLNIWKPRWAGHGGEIWQTVVHWRREWQTTSVFLPREINQFGSVTQLYLTLCDPVDCSIPDLHVHHQLPELAQTHVHWVGDAIQPSHPLLSPCSSAFDLSQHQDLFQWVSSLHQVAKVLEFQLQHQSFQWTPRTDLP